MNDSPAKKAINSRINPKTIRNLPSPGLGLLSVGFFFFLGDVEAPMYEVFLPIFYYFLETNSDKNRKNKGILLLVDLLVFRR